MSSCDENQSSKVMEFPFLSDAEKQLIRVVRARTNSRDFSVTIRTIDGRFFVAQSNRSEIIGPALGAGDTFEQAWKAAGRF